MQTGVENVVKESTDFNNSNLFSANNKNVKLRAIRTKVTHIIGNVTVEPVLFAYMLCSAISSMAVQNLNLEKSCRVNMAYDDDVCTNIMNGNITNLDEETKKVQTLVAQVVAWKFPLQTAIPAFMALFVGAWSDRTGNRKACMFFPFFGEVVCNIGMILATYFFYEVPLEATAVIEALPPALTGGWIIMFMGMYSYVADITTEEDRTLRLGIVTIFVTVGTPLGTSLSGILTKSLGFYGVFSLLICIHCSSLTFAYFKVKSDSGKRVSGNKEELKNEEQSQAIKESCCRRYLLSNHVVETVQVAFKPRPGHKRLMIFFTFLIYFIMVGPLYGDSQVAYLYARYKFRFDEVDYSLFTTYNVVIGIFGTMFAIGVLSRRCGVHDSTIGLLAGTSRVAACTLLALAGTRALFYCAPVLNAFSHCGLTAVRAIASKLVHPTEMGKMNSLMGVFEALTPAVYMPASSAIYVATISVLPGAFYLMDAAITLIAIVLFRLIYVFSTRDVVKNPKRKEQFARDNEISSF